MANNNEVRLQKFMAEQGVASRRKSEDLIRAGKVKVNGHVAEIGMKINPRKDLVTVGKQKLTNVKNRKMVYVMLNKPRGYVTTVSDELGRKTVMDLLPDFGCRIYPVGRLDKDSEGLLLLTNDGSFTNCMTHPSHEYAKVYRVTVRPAVNDDILFNLRNGIEIDGRMTAPCEVTVLTEEENRVVLEFILHEGRNRQIRKMCESQGLEVARLKRISIGPVKLGMLKQGDYRELTEQDVKKLLRSAGHKEN
ncbi:MAG: pseudouridine synthase [Eubacterium coprostanoligenes]|uniref:pseudouridine synthase n=1 Tax=Eubacterium coprostanoligenes TaxID=290054 RepID=UPI0023F1DB8A|nr:pseudouridine synthase [Eubacterium coprostanoligenes]MDD6665203.1 pseudouridine synthase [Eubacterium coprostanoligenes]MDD7358345.1 pseudouridine synthase [Eubacterium coprostanoligenes]